jgi:hypothetical protein
MQVEDRLPLLICHLVDDAVPSVARVVDDDVDFAIAEGGGFLDEGCDVRGGEHVAGDGEGGSAGGVDCVGDFCGFFWEGCELVLYIGTAQCELVRR